MYEMVIGCPIVIGKRLKTTVNDVTSNRTSGSSRCSSSVGCEQSIAGAYSKIAVSACTTGGRMRTMCERQRRRSGVCRGLTTASATERVFPIQETVRVRRGSRDVFMNERARAIVLFGGTVAGDGTPLDGPSGRVAGERG